MCFKVLANRKTSIAIALLILIIAAIWYAWKISTFGTLSESDAKWWIHTSELLLVASAVLLAAGLFGEWPDSESWKKRLLYKAAKAAVIIGVVGELLGDGGIFEAGDRLQEIEGKAINAAKTDATTANARAAEANTRAAELQARNIELLKALAPREFEMASFMTLLKPYAGSKVFFAAVPDFEARRVVKSLMDIFWSSQWEITTRDVRIDEKIPDGITLSVVNGALVHRIVPPDAPMPPANIEFVNENGLKIANIICNHLKDINVEATVDRIPPDWPYSSHDVRLASDPPDALLIEVGFKPSTYFSDEQNPVSKAARQRIEASEKRAGTLSPSLVCLP